MKTLKILCALWLVAAVAACASPAQVGSMVVAPQANSVAVPDGLRKAIYLEAVGGGEETSPMWMSKVSSSGLRDALDFSLAAHTMAAGNADRAQYLLSANLNALDQPVMGFDATVTSSVDYRLLEKSTQKEVFREVVTAPYTAKFTDSLMGVERLRLANEGSIKENIRIFIERLQAHFNNRGKPGA